MNKVMFTGFLGRTPEIRTTNEGKMFCRFSVAVTEYINKEPHTTWYNCMAFGKCAEYCGKYLCKGSKALITGRLNADRGSGGPRVFTGQDGTVRATYEVFVNSVENLSPKKDDVPAVVNEECDY